MRLTAVMTQPRLNLTRGTSESLDRLERQAEEVGVAAKSSSERKGERGPGEVDLPERQDTRVLFEQGNLLH